ncbi:MAG: LLM class flavin-dependent oxidoreductase [Acidimicrobiales bacterium]
MTEVWATGISLPGVAVRMAQRAEADGFDGWFVVDSQNLAGDCYVALAQAAVATERILLGTGVTNPFTRHPAVTASAIASVHAASGGRAVLGIGRGDSALAHLGLAPAPVSLFEPYLAQVQAYLRGEEVGFDALGSEVVAEVGSMGLAGGPAASRLHWLPPGLPKVPVTVAATGPKVIDAAARHADRVTFALGADPERVRWGVERARAVRPDVGLGAFVNVVCHDDVDTARALASGGMSTFARFNVMHGTTHGPMADGSRELLQGVRGVYDMQRHTQAGSPQAERLTPEFAEGFAVLGSPDRCIARLRELTDLGLDHLVIVGPSLGSDPTEARAAHHRFVTEVLPALRG